MVSPDAPPRPRGLRIALAALAGLVLVFGGTCGVGPTSLSLLAVSGTQSPVPDDARGQVPVPVAAEVAQPARHRIVRRSATRLVLRVVRTRLRRGAWRLGLAARRAPPPLRGPPPLVA